MTTVAKAEAFNQKSQCMVLVVKVAFLQKQRIAKNQKYSRLS
jgi:hypothetical protein